MRNKILSIVFVAASLCNAFATLTASIHSEARKTFYVGERAYIPVYIEETNAMTEDIHGGTGANGYVISHVSGSASWLTYNRRPDYANGTELNTSDPDNHWYNNQVIWLEMAGLATTAGEYSGTLLVQNTLTGESQNINYSFSVVEPPPALYVVSYDAAASYGRQIEQYSYILNKTDSSVTLDRPYIDYYMTKTPNKQLLLNIWSRPSNTCVQVLDCGAEHYVIRQQYKGNLKLEANAFSEEFQLGINERSNGNNPSLFDFLPEKALHVFSDVKQGYLILPDGSFSNAYLDYSYAGFATNYVAKAMHRNDYYNRTMTLRDISGMTYYGVAPDWYVEGQCRNATISTASSLNANVIRTFDEEPFCNDDILAITFTTPEDTIFEGEDYYAMPVVTGGNGKIVYLEITDMSGYDWLETGTPADYWDDYANVVGSLGLKGFTNMFYVRSRHGFVRQNYNLDPGVYTYTLRATDAAGQVATVTRTVRIMDGLNYAVDKNLGSGVVSNHGIAVLMGDETWFKSYQLDIATGIENFANSGSFTFANGFYYDYYGQFDKGFITSSMNHPHDWYLNPGFTETFYDCGNNRFRIRYTYHSGNDFWISNNQSRLDMKSGIVYNTSSRMNKADDYSMQDFVKNGVLELRGRRYNPHMPLYDGYGTRLWGIAPDWANQCVDFDELYLSSSSSSNSSSSYSSCTSSSSISSNSSMSSSSRNVIVRRSSSSSFSVFRDLAIRFKDDGGNSERERRFKIDVINKGDEAASIGGYVARFYYNDEHLPSEAILHFNNYSHSSDISDVQMKQCDEHHYVADFIFSQNVSISPSGTLPANGVDGVFRIDQGEALNVQPFASWKNYSQLTENRDMALFDADGGLVYGNPHWPCNDYTKKSLRLVVKGHIKKENHYFSKLNDNVDNAAARVNLSVENFGDSIVLGPAYIDFQVTHPTGMVPVIDFYDGKTLATTGETISISNGIKVTRISAGDKHTFRIVLLEGIKKNNLNFEFLLYDQCVDCCKDKSEVAAYLWDLSDDWSAEGIVDTPGDKDVETRKVIIYNSEGDLLYGKADPQGSVYADYKNNGGIKQPRVSIDSLSPNRTDAVSYSGGQLLSGGDFETSWVQGWNIYGDQGSSPIVRSVRAPSPQGARYLFLGNLSSISQDLSEAAIRVLADSGAVLTIWHKGGAASVKINGTNVGNLKISRNLWVVDTIRIEPLSFNLTGYSVLSIATTNDTICVDNAVLVPSESAQPVTYATRFTNTLGEEIETRTYDGLEEQLITTSERDPMGRLWKKYLPFAMPCNSVVECNSSIKTLNYPDMAKLFYTKNNSDYPDAGGVPYAETIWKPDQRGSIDVVGGAGVAFGVDSAHLSRTFSSGVNLANINVYDSVSLNSAVAAIFNIRRYGAGKHAEKDTNYHAAKDKNPTHLWELVIDRDEHKLFMVKDGEGRIFISGSLDKNGNLLTYGVNEFDARGNVIKAHSPMSCDYTNASVNCVTPSTYDYDSQSRVIRTVEPDAGESRTYYDIAGRVRATQMQNQIDSGACSVVGYDHLDRTIFTGEWKCGKDEDSLRKKFMRVSAVDSPFVDELTPGTITRTFYDRVPTRDTLGVQLYPQGIVAAPTYTRGRVAAVVSDVKAVFNDDGTPKLAADGKDSVIRVSFANSYDKYGRVLASYTYDPTLPDSLKQLWATTQYDLGGKVLSATKYPYGYSFTSVINRDVKESYVYDRLGRVSKIMSRYGNTPETELARYEYYPTGSVKTVVLGNSLTLSYTYHISGAMKTATVMSADNRELYADTLYYEDCGGNGCTPQYNGNISRMAHHLAHGNSNYGEFRDVLYTYDELNRLIKVDDKKQDVFDEMFTYDAQGRITAQRRGDKVKENVGGEYSYYSKQNRLKSVAHGMGGTADSRNMEADSNFVYDSEGNLVEDKSKRLKIFYDWRGMPIEFIQQPQPTGSSSDTLFKLTMAYDGLGRRISKTSMRKVVGNEDWDTTQVTHYTGIGTEVRENYAGPAKETKVVVNMPQGLGRYGIEDADPNANFEWYLKNHLGSTMLVYGTEASTTPDESDVGATLAAYDYRAFGEMIEMLPPAQKVTENFTGKEHDDEIALDYFGARYLDPMLGMWVSVDLARQFASPYLYAGNGMNPIGGLDPSGMYFTDGKRKTEGEFISPEFQGMVSPEVLDDLIAAQNAFMGVLNDILTAAAYTEGEYGGETSFWIKDGTTNNWATTPPGSKSIPSWSGSGIFFHTHLERGIQFSDVEGLSTGDKNMSLLTVKYRLSAFEVSSGRIFYYNPNYPSPSNINNHPQYGFMGYDIMQIPKQKYWIDPQNYWNLKPTLPPKTHYFQELGQ